jgi:hypothetical protein
LLCLCAFSGAPLNGNQYAASQSYWSNGTLCTWIITILRSMNWLTILSTDFPTGGIIYGYEGVREAFKTGRGRGRAKVGFEEVEEESLLSLPKFHQVNKADMIKRTADLVNDKKLKELQIFVMNQIEMVCVSFIFWSVMLHQT